MSEFDFDNLDFFVEEEPIEVVKVEEKTIIDYFEWLTGWAPTKDQSAVLLSAVKSKRIIISAGRQSGKTVVVAVLVMWWIFEDGRKLKILLVSAQDNIVYYYIKNFFDLRNILSGRVVTKGRTRAVPMSGFTTSEGSELFVRGSTERNIRGIPADIVVIDEGCSLHDDSILTAIGNLSGAVSKLVLLSTPHNPNRDKTKYPLFIKWLNDPELHDFKAYTWSSEGLPWHTKDLLDMKKREFSPARYAIEVLGRLPTEEEWSLSGDLIGSVIMRDKRNQLIII